MNRSLSAIEKAHSLPNHPHYGYENHVYDDDAYVGDHDHGDDDGGGDDCTGHHGHVNDYHVA